MALITLMGLDQLAGHVGSEFSQLPANCVKRPVRSDDVMRNESIESDATRPGNPVGSPLPRRRVHPPTDGAWRGRLRITVWSAR